MDYLLNTVSIVTAYKYYPDVRFDTNSLAACIYVPLSGRERSHMTSKIIAAPASLRHFFIPKNRQ